MNILTEEQITFIKLFSLTSLKDSFFLTGGTALSEFYLQHRLSEDLDFFTDEPAQIPFVLPYIKKICEELKVKLEIRKQFRTYLEVFIYFGEKNIVKCDFAQDSPYRLEQKVLQEQYGIFSDNLLDISCNKLSALFDRSDAKDFVDIYFLDKNYISFNDLLVQAKKKHIGLDDYWLSASLKNVEKISILPRMLKPLSLEEMKSFFNKKARELIKKVY
jgi:predicted nucleotidyltransferase component of viral defense system